jgi:hypothetical protein
VSRIINPGKGIIGIREGPQPADESEHFYVCAACGRAVDMRDLGQVLHHEQPKHEPIDWDS